MLRVARNGEKNNDLYRDWCSVDWRHSRPSRKICSAKSSRESSVGSPCSLGWQPTMIERFPHPGAPPMAKASQSLLLTAQAYDAMIAHCVKGSALACCGILAGIPPRASV